MLFFLKRGPHGRLVVPNGPPSLNKELTYLLVWDGDEVLQFLSLKRIRNVKAMIRKFEKISLVKFYKVLFCFLVTCTPKHRAGRIFVVVGW